MKTIARLALVAAAALGAAVFFSGCTTARVAQAKRPQRFFEMTVLQSSGAVELSPKEMAQLREAVINFVQKEGVLHDGAYYVEVKFNQAAGETEGGTIVVKLVERDAADYEMVASSYSSRWPYYYYDPFYDRYGYASFGNYPFDSYDYAYGGGGSYYPPQGRLHPGDHHRPNDGDDHHDGNDHHDGGPNDNDHNNNDHHHDGRTDVARHDGHDGHGDYHPPTSGGDHHSPESHRRWESGDSSGSHASSSSSSSNNSSSYSSNSSSNYSSSSGSSSSYSSSSSSSSSAPDTSSRGGDVRDNAPQNLK